MEQRERKKQRKRGSNIYFSSIFDSLHILHSRRDQERRNRLGYGIARNNFTISDRHWRLVYREKRSDKLNKSLHVF